MRERVTVALRKNVLGLPSLLAAAIGLIVASSTLVSLGQGMGMGGYYFVWAQVIAFVLMIFQAFTFSELAQGTVFPGDRGRKKDRSSSRAKRSIGKFFGP